MSHTHTHTLCILYSRSVAVLCARPQVSQSVWMIFKENDCVYYVNSNNARLLKCMLKHMQQAHMTQNGPNSNDAEQMKKRATKQDKGNMMVSASGRATCFWTGDEMRFVLCHSKRSSEKKMSITTKLKRVVLPLIVAELEILCTINWFPCHVCILGQGQYSN